MTLAVTSEIDPVTGRYGLAVQVGEDAALALDPAAGLRYAAAVLAAAAHAEHDRAVLAQCTHVFGLDMREAGRAVAWQREHRQPVDDEATAPLRWEPGVSVFSGEPFIAVYLHGRQVFQLTTPQAAEHAAGVLRGAAACDADDAYYRYLTEVVGAAEPAARAAVEGISAWYGDPPG